MHHIYDGPLSLMASPWAVLGCCAAKVLALVPPNVTLPPIIGGPGSLNWYVILAAPTGGGKGAALDAADELIKVSAPVLQRNIGSGEGMIDAYRKPKDEATGEPAGVHESLLFVADEVDTLAAMTRSSSTVLATLCSAFSGKTLGASTKASSGFHLTAQQYRMTLIVGAQPARSTPILESHTSGVPQRFMRLPALDARVTEDEVPFPGPLDIPTGSDKWRYGAALKIPDEARKLIRQTRAKAQQGQQNPLDSHALFVREKFAYALAVLDNRDHMTLEDWELAGIAMEVSDYTRAWVIAGHQSALDSEAEKYGRAQGVKHAAAYEASRCGRPGVTARLRAAFWAWCARSVTRD